MSDDLTPDEAVYGRKRCDDMGWHTECPSWPFDDGYEVEHRPYAHPNPQEIKSRRRERVKVLTDTVTFLSVQPGWMVTLPLQQQSVLMLAARGPDGIAKHHPCKEIVRAYRGTVLLAARYGRSLYLGEHADTFMSLRSLSRMDTWTEAMDAFFDSIDSLPHHYAMHLLHGAEILGYRHPEPGIKLAWEIFYKRGVTDLHLRPETSPEMDERLSDWGRKDWGDDHA